MNSNKFIFLDIDGVLNDLHTPVCMPDKNGNVISCGIIGVEQQYLARLKNIVDATGAKIILSSTWRYYFDNTDPKCHMGNYLAGELAKYNLRIDGVTRDTDYSNNYRGQEIIDWINNFEQNQGPIDRFVILDDETSDIVCFEKLKQHTVRTVNEDSAYERVYKGTVYTYYNECGLSDGNVEEAIRILNR